MSLDAPKKTKMMTAPASQKQYFFAPSPEYHAEVVYADTIEEATETYHRVKRLISPPEQSTAPAAVPEEEKEVQ